MKTSEISRLSSHSRFLEKLALKFLEKFWKITPSRGRNAVQMPHYWSIPGDQMPPPPGHFLRSKKWNESLILAVSLQSWLPCAGLYSGKPTSL